MSNDSPAILKTGRSSNAVPNMQTIVPRTPEGQQIREALAQPVTVTDFTDLEQRVLGHLAR